MSYNKLSGFVAVLVTALTFAGAAYATSGGNGAPGPAGNPNQPAGTPQANGPQGPAGNSAQGQSDASSGQSDASHGKSDASHGKSDASHGKSGASHGKSGASHGKSDASHGKSGASHGKSNSHANPTPGTPRKGGREDRPAGKITICHATKSEKNPYVEITISVNGLHGHGPAEDPRHHAGSWQDIIPAPAGGCPSTVQQQSQQESTPTAPTQPTTVTTTTLSGDVAHFVVAPEAPAEQAVLGERESGGNAPAGESKVLGASASGTTAPASTQAARAAGGDSGSLPFTGFQLAFVLILAAAALLGGFALRRAAGKRA